MTHQEWRQFKKDSRRQKRADLSLIRKMIRAFNRDWQTKRMRIKYKLGKVGA